MTGSNCSLLPDSNHRFSWWRGLRCAASVTEVLNSDAEQITLQWPNPELYGAPLVGYNIYMDNGMGGELTFYKHVSAQEARAEECLVLPARGERARIGV